MSILGAFRLLQLRQLSKRVLVSAQVLMSPVLTRCRIDGIADEDGAAEHEPWALPPGSEGYDQLIPTLPADLLDLVGEDTGDNGLAIRVDDEPVRATPSVTALNETSLHDRLKSYVYRTPGQ